VKNEITLVGLEIEGEWNVPLLKNAAEMSGASLLFAKSEVPANHHELNHPSPEIDDLLGQFDQVLACEAVRQSRSVYECAAPRGRVGVIVGNERRGIPSKVLKKADQVVSVPMIGRGLSSVNVAVAAAIILYAMERDLGRKRFRTSSLSYNNVDILISCPPNPCEIGSLLRSAWAFGWQRVFLTDPGGAWFTKDRSKVLAGRAAARCEVNRIAVCPEGQLNLQDYDQVVVCDSERTGTPLSRFTFPTHGRVLLVYGDGEISSLVNEATNHIFVDYAAAPIEASFRHAGSILFSVVSQQLRQRHG